MSGTPKVPEPEASHVCSVPSSDVGMAAAGAPVLDTWHDGHGPRHLFAKPDSCPAAVGIDEDDARRLERRTDVT